VPATEASQYESPAIEQVITRDGFEREVAYAGFQITPDPNT
jgi:hypothetical protein